MAKQRCLLVIEDDPQQREIIQGVLAQKGYRVVECEGIQDGLHAFSTRTPDLVILDVNLKDGSGMEACRKIRAHKSRFATPIIMLTGRAKVEDKAEGFSAGADQYLVKPISPKELGLWVEALLHRLDYEEGVGGELEAGDLSIDPASHLVRFRGEQVAGLTAKEFDLFFYLVKRRPRLFTRQQLLSAVWRTVRVDHVVDQHLYTLRRKLPQPLADKIQSIPGKGFRYLE